MNALVGLRSPTAQTEEAWRLRIYVAGQSPKSLLAIANLHNLCEEHLTGRYEIEIIDLIEQPARARTDDIVALPTVVRQFPAPQCRIIGDLSDTERVRAGMQF